MTESLATELQGSKTKAEALLMTYDLVRSPVSGSSLGLFLFCSSHRFFGL